MEIPSSVELRLEEACVVSQVNLEVLSFFIGFPSSCAGKLQTGSSFTTLFSSDTSFLNHNVLQLQVRGFPGTRKQTRWGVTCTSLNKSDASFDFDFGT